MSIKISEITSDNLDDYRHFITSRAHSSFVDAFEWRQMVEQVYGHRHYWYTCHQNGKIIGSLALTLTRHPLLGSHLATAPFASYGGFHWASEPAARSLLVKAEELCGQTNAKYVVLRHLDRSGPITLPSDWHEDRSYATYYLPLESDPDYFLHNHLRSKARKKIQDAKDHGFTSKFGKDELLPDFWYVIGRSMKELGSPYHSYTYLNTLMTTLKDRASVAVLYDHMNNPACCRLFIQMNRCAYSIHGNSLLKYRHLNAGDYFFWKFIQECYSRGIQFIDMGRSLVGSGNETWKMKWRPQRYPLSYWYYLPNGQKIPNVNQNNPKYQILIKTWRMMPLFLQRLVGPGVIRGIL